MLIYIFLFVFNILTIPFYVRKPKFYLVINLIPLWWLMAFRSVYVGADTITYSKVFYQSDVTQIPMDLANWLAPVNGARFENGFLLLNKVIYDISPNFRLMLITTVTIMILSLSFFLIGLNINYIIGILIYESILMPFSMNAMRQALAISLCMVAFTFLIKKRINYFLVFNYLAITMHVTAWLFLIVLIYKHLKYGWKSKIFIVIVTIITSLSFERIYGRISTVSDEAKTFSNSISSNNLNGSLNIIFSILLILFISGWSSHYIKAAKINKNMLIINSHLMLLTAIAFYIIALRFSQITRIATYFTMGYYPLLSLLSGGFYLKKKRNIAFILICAFLIIYFLFIQIYRPEWANITPYSMWGSM